jgi:hypothetical protein
LRIRDKGQVGQATKDRIGRAMLPYNTA